MEKNLDLRYLFNKVKLSNKSYGGSIDPSFDTTDIAYLHSLDEIRYLPLNKKAKSISDFALSNCAWLNPPSAMNGTNKGDILLRTSVKDYSYDNDGYVLYIDAIGNANDVLFVNKVQHCAQVVALNLNTQSLTSALKNNDVKITTGRYPYIELGEYPGKIANKDLQNELENAYLVMLSKANNEYNNEYNYDTKDELTCTGRLFTTNGQKNSSGDFLSKQSPEFEYKGEKYVRVVVWNYRNQFDYRYENGSMVPLSSFTVWHKVEPVKLEILNWDDLPKSINPEGTGKADEVKTETEKCVLAGLPFYPCRNDENCELWQNSLPRAFLNSAKSSELDGNPDFKARLEWDFSKSGFLYQAFDLTREPTREYTIPDNEKAIADYAFAGCMGIEKIIIPSQVKQIGDFAFTGCINAQLVFNNPNNLLKFPAHSELRQNGYKFTYLSKDGQNVTFSPREDLELENSCIKKDFQFEDFDVFLNNNFRINYVKTKIWKESGKIKFIPPDYTLQIFPSSEIEKYFLNNNNLRWGKLVKTLGFDTLHEPDKNNSLSDLIKIYYAIGGFSANQGESEKAYDYILKYVANQKTPEDNGLFVHSHFSKLDLKGPFNPDFAKFFMKYYKYNPDFMNFRLRDKDGEMMEKFDYLCVAHNAFDRIQKSYPNRVVNGNEERSLLSPRFVAEHCLTIEYENVEEGNEKLAEIVGKYGYSQEAFEHIQRVYDMAKEIKDKYVISADKSSGQNGIHFRVLEKDDPLGFVLGDITNCCQHIGGAGASCVDDGYKNPKAGFIVFEETILDKNGVPTGKTRILGQAYIWYDPKTKTVCYDNIEIPTKILKELKRGANHDERLSSKTLLNAVVESADAIMTSMNKKGIEVKQVTTGRGFNDLATELKTRFGSPEENPKAKHRNYRGYTDANEAQFLIRTYDETTKYYASSIRQIGNEIKKDLDNIQNRLDETNEI